MKEIEVEVVEKENEPENPFFQKVCQIFLEWIEEALEIGELQENPS